MLTWWIKSDKDNKKPFSPRLNNPSRGELCGWLNGCGPRRQERRAVGL